MDRRGFLRGLAGMAISGLFPWLQQPQPNIVFILADDLGYGDLGCYGQQQILTPHLDSLAAGGLRFTQAYSPAPVCSPSRWSLMTGREPGKLHNIVNGYTDLQPDDATFPQSLKAAGYHNVCFGRWSIGDVAAGNSPLDRGFDYFLGHMLQGESDWFYPDFIYENRARDLPLPGNENGAEGLWFSDFVTDKAIDFIHQPHPEPFFLYAPYDMPHANSGQNEMLTPSDAPYTNEPWPQQERNFASLVTRLDSYVGRIVAALEAEGLLDNTLIVFSSDNGAHQEGQHSELFFNSTGGLRGHKRDLYEGGIRVPTIAYWRGRIAPGVSDLPWCLYDLAATFLSLAAAAIPDDLDSRSILPTLLGYPQPAREYFYWIFIEAGVTKEAVRIGDFKGIRAGEMWELFNLADDPGEAVNLAEAQPEIIWQMGMVMDGYCPAPKICRLNLPFTAFYRSQ